MIRAIDLLKISEGVLKRLSKVGVKVDDFKYIEMYGKYTDMKQKGHKRDYINAKLANKYNISETTVYRIICRLEKQVKI